MAFMFAWQFLFSGPLEIASAGIGMVQYLSYPLAPAGGAFAGDETGRACLIWRVWWCHAISQIKDGPADVRAVDRRRR